MHFNPFWLLIPLISILLDVKRVRRMPFRDRRDMLLAVSFFPNEIFNTLRCIWYVQAWAVAPSHEGDTDRVGTCGAASTRQKEGGDTHVRPQALLSAPARSASLAATGYNSLALVLAAVSLIIGGVGLIRLGRPCKVEI